jgi:hypothetical protein
MVDERENISTINTFFISLLFLFPSIFSPFLGRGRLVGVRRDYITTLGCNGISISTNPI